MESGQIPDSDIVASIRSFGKNTAMFGPHRARLRSSLAFRADPLAVEQWSFHFIKVKLPEEMILTGIATQGFGSEWVSKFKLMATTKNGDSYIHFRDVHSAISEKVRTD